jgi:DUF4097 and DUF4098 domain-containing protein YvlB
LSVGPAIILLYNERRKMNYQKYTWICPGDCDALIEYTFKDGYGWPAGVMDLTCRCGTACILLSVVDATIPSTTTTKEETMEETTTPQVMTLDWVENDVVTNKSYTESDVRHMVWQLKNLTNKQNEWYKKESQLRTFIHDNFENSDDQEALTEIAEMFDIPLTKEIEVTVWVRVDATVEVELSGGDSFDAVEDFISSNLTVDSYASEMSVNNFEIERCEEGAY